MAGPLSGQVAVITGGASGIGRATTLRFLAEGASVVVGDLNVASGHHLVEEVADPRRLMFLPTDVSEEAQIEALIGATVERFGGLDILFNNAGVSGAFGPLTEIASAHWDRTFAVLARSVFLGIKHGARVMIEQARGGSIMNTASVAGLSGGAGPAVYSAAKAAVINLTYNAAVELAPHCIRVNVICPGIVHTPLGPAQADKTTRRSMAAVQPWPETGQPEDIAGLALYLAGPDSQFVTGEAIRADGGILAAGPRLLEAADPHGTTKRYAGYSEGSTGLPAEAHRRVDVEAADTRSEGHERRTRGGTSGDSYQPRAE